MASHGLKLSIAKHIPTDPGIVATNTVKVRERIGRFLFGAPRKLMIIVPGESVDQIDIHEKPNPDESLIALAEAVGITKAGEAK